MFYKIMANVDYVVKLFYDVFVEMYTGKTEWNT